MPGITPIFPITTIPDIALWLTATPIWICSSLQFKSHSHGKREGEESLLTRVVSRCAASVSLSAVGVSSDDQSGRGWVEKDIGREGRGRKTKRERGEKRFNLCLDNAALSRQIIIHEPIYIIPCTGALSYHSHALKYHFLPAFPTRPFPRCIKRGAYVYAIDKRNCGSPHRSNAPARDAWQCIVKLSLMCDARRHFRYAQVWRYANLRMLRWKNWDTIFFRRRRIV